MNRQQRKLVTHARVERRVAVKVGTKSPRKSRAKKAFGRVKGAGRRRAGIR